ncbi:hypothetical protein AB0M39_38115 [Streptomyces sp. NPDC051907]|uniref:hypothetical protein n=1 Tax=Streptomyces sp. NPDC051907 TaxID=3155284 RepID=UPI003424F6B1
MTKETRPHATATCIFCQKRVTRAYPESPWRTEDGGWKCPASPRAADSGIHPHEATA